MLICWKGILWQVHHAGVVRASAAKSHSDLAWRRGLSERCLKQVQVPALSAKDWHIALYIYSEYGQV